MSVSITLLAVERVTHLSPASLPLPPLPPPPPSPSPSPTSIASGSSRSALRSYLESLATPVFLHRLGTLLFFYHCLLLFTAVSTIAVYCLVYSPQPSSTSLLLLFVIFHSIKSVTSILLLILRACYPHLWHTHIRPNESWLSSFDTVTRQFHHIHLLCRVCFLGWLVLGTLWYSEPGWDGVERPLMLEVVVLAVLVLEYAVVALHAVVFAQLLCVFPYSQLSIALPFIPISLPDSVASNRRGLTDKQIRALPLSSYHLPQAAVGQTEASGELCAVCLSALSEGELVRRLHCRHCFHQVCVDEWLVRRAVCPLCVRTVTAAEQRIAEQLPVRSAVEFSSAGGSFQVPTEPVMRRALSL